MSFKKQSDKILGWERLRAEVEELWEEARLRSMPRNKCLGQSSTHLGERRGGAGALEVRPIVKLPCAELDVFRGGSTGSAGRLVSRCLGGFAIDANRASESATEASTTKGGEKWLLIAVLPMCPFLLTSNFSIFHQRPYGSARTQLRACCRSSSSAAR